MQSGTSGQHVDRVKQLMAIMKGIVERSKQGDTIGDDDWQPLAELVDTASFQRVGPFHDEVDWDGYLQVLNGWVNHSEGWDPVVKSMTEVPGLVYAQCEEMVTKGDEVSPFYSLSRYEFDEQGKISRIDVYMQAAGLAVHY